MRKGAYDDAAFGGGDSSPLRLAFLDENTSETIRVADFLGAAVIVCYVATGDFPGERHAHVQPTSLLKNGST